jgi:hypothetical protein
MRVIVTGGRDFHNIVLVDYCMSRLNAKRPISCLIHGACHGLDLLCADWATSNGIETEAYPADWKLHGRSAGPIRNAHMLQQSSPDVAVVFAGGRGTAHMHKLLVSRGIPVWNLQRYGL